MKRLNLSTFKFPEMNPVDEIFPTAETNTELLEEARLRGYCDKDLAGNKIFNSWFFRGIKEVTIRDKKNAQPAYAYMRSLIGSFAPKHEHKEAVCAMIIDEFLKVELNE